MADQKNTPSQYEIATEWLRISIERFQKAIEKSGVGMERKNLFNSFISSIEKDSDGMVQRALIRFKFYGRYVDMGVGRGVPIGSRAAKMDYYKYRNNKGQLLNYGRKPKKWYSKTLAAQSKKLSELMSQHFGIKAIQVLEASNKKIEVSI